MSVHSLLRPAWRIFRAPAFSPTGFLVRAALLLLLFLALRAAGLAGYVSILSGSLAAGSQQEVISAALGVVYASAWFAAVLLAPILIIAAGLLAVAQHAIMRGRRGS